MNSLMNHPITVIYLAVMIGGTAPTMVAFARGIVPVGALVVLLGACAALAEIYGALP